VSPGRKTSKSLLRNRNTRAAVRVMLPVKTRLRTHDVLYDKSRVHQTTHVVAAPRVWTGGQWSYPPRSYIFQASSISVQEFRSPRVVEFLPFPLLRFLAFTTTCTIVPVVITSLAVGMRSTAISMSVCLSVCLSARVSQTPHSQLLPCFLYMLYV